MKKRSELLPKQVLACSDAVEEARWLQSDEKLAQELQAEEEAPQRAAALPVVLHQALRNKCFFNNKLLRTPFNHPVNATPAQLSFCSILAPAEEQQETSVTISSMTPCKTRKKRIHAILMQEGLHVEQSRNVFRALSQQVPNAMDVIEDSIEIGISSQDTLQNLKHLF